MKINIPEVLVHLRQTGRKPVVERTALRGLSWLMRSPRRYAAAQRLVRVGAAPLRLVARRRGMPRRLPWPLSRWTGQRDAPVPPAQTFREWWARERS